MWLLFPWASYAQIWSHLCQRELWDGYLLAWARGLGLLWEHLRDPVSPHRHSRVGVPRSRLLTMALSPEYELPGHDEAWRSEDKLPSLFSFLVGSRDGTQAWQPATLPAEPWCRQHMLILLYPLQAQLDPSLGAHHLSWARVFWKQAMNR